MSGIKELSNKEIIYNVLGKEYSEEIAEHFTNLLYGFYEKRNLNGKVYINETVANQCLLDMLIDLARFCDFHDIHIANLTKIYAFFASWVIKRKPFQLIDMQTEEDDVMFVNEVFALTLIIDVTEIITTQYPSNKENKLYRSLDAIYYHLKYRNTSPKTLLLLINGLEAGIVCTTTSYEK